MENNASEMPPKELGSTQLFAPGQAVFLKDQTGDSVYQVKMGTIRFCSYIKGGQRLVSGFAFPNEYFSLSHCGRHIYAAEAVSTVSIRVTPRKYIEQMAASGKEPWNDVLLFLANEPWELQIEILKMLHKNAEQSVANFILDLARRLNSVLENGTRIRLEMSRVDMSDYLGLTVETVVRALRRLIREGHLLATNPHEVVIANLDELRIRADGLASFWDGGRRGSEAIS